MTGPRQPRTCSHPINAQMLTGVCQAVRIFSSYYFHVFVSIGSSDQASEIIRIRNRNQPTNTLCPTLIKYVQINLLVFIPDPYPVDPKELGLGGMAGGDLELELVND